MPQELTIYCKRSVALYAPHLQIEALGKPCKQDGMIAAHAKRENHHAFLCLQIMKFPRFLFDKTKHNASYNNPQC